MKTLAEIIAAVKELKSTVADFISGKISASIEQLAQLRAKLDALETETVTHLGQLELDLAAARATIKTDTETNSNLTAQLATVQQLADSRREEIEKAGLALDTFLKSLRQDPAAHATLPLKISATTKALETILASQGIRVNDLPGTQPGGALGQPSSTILAEHEAIIDPVQKVAHYRANKAAIDAAWKLKHR